jgi:hypothetical protein
METTAQSSPANKYLTKFNNHFNYTIHYLGKQGAIPKKTGARRYVCSCFEIIRENIVSRFWEYCPNRVVQTYRANLPT